MERQEPDAPDFLEDALPLSGVGETVSDRADIDDSGLWPTRDADWYRFWFSPGGVPGTVRVALRTPGTAEAGAVRGQLCQAGRGGCDLAGSRSVVVGDNVFTLTVVEGGWWYIRIENTTITSPHDYSLTLKVDNGATVSDLCPELDTGNVPGPGCWLGGGDTARSLHESAMVAADLAESVVVGPGTARREDLDNYVLCLEEDQSVSILLDDRGHRMRIELRDPVVRDPSTGSDVAVSLPAPWPSRWGYNVMNSFGTGVPDVPAWAMLIATAEHGNAPGVQGAIMHFVSPVTQCYLVTVRASFGEDRVANSDVRSRAVDDEEFVKPVRYRLVVTKGCVPGTVGCEAIRPVPSTF